VLGGEHSKIYNLLIPPQEESIMSTPSKKKDKVDQLSIDVTNEVAGVDSILSKIIKDKAKWNDFFRNPAQTLAEAGYLQPYTDGDAQKYNQLFYALLTDNELMSFVHTQQFCPQMTSNQVDEFHTNLKEDGVIKYPPEVDVDIVRRLLNDAPAFKKLLTLSLSRINEEKIFDRYYSEKKINKAVSTIMANAKAGNSFSEMVSDLPWQDECDEGGSGGVNRILAVIPPAVAIPVVAEAVACGTVACVVVPLAKSGLAKHSVHELGGQALSGDRDAMHAMQTIGLLFEFISELSAHIKNFEKILHS